VAYLNLDLDFFEHPKTRRLVGLLGKGVEVLPIKLWCYCGKYHVESGKLTDHSAQEIESILGWWGKSGELVQAMVKVGFLIFDGEYCVKDWEEHSGHLKFFKERAKTAAKKRWGISNASSNACDEAKQSPIPTNQTIPTEPTKKDKLAWFEEIWTKYPNKDGKKASERYFLASVLNENDWKDIQTALKNYLASERVKKGFIKNASTWFNNWRDWVSPHSVVTQITKPIFTKKCYLETCGKEIPENEFAKHMLQHQNESVAK